MNSRTVFWTTLVPRMEVNISPGNPHCPLHPPGCLRSHFPHQLWWHLSTTVSVSRTPATALTKTYYSISLSLSYFIVSFILLLISYYGQFISQTLSWLWKHREQEVHVEFGSMCGFRVKYYKTMPRVKGECYTVILFLASTRQKQEIEKASDSFSQ